MSTTLRFLGFGVLAIAAVAAFVFFTPKIVTSSYSLSSASQYETLIGTALADDATNNLLTQGAPQQAVVNGWTARDLLTIIAKEQADILRAQGAIVDATGILQTQPFDQRIPALLLIAVIAICWSGLTAPRSARETTAPVFVPSVSPA